MCHPSEVSISFISVCHVWIWIEFIHLCLMYRECGSCSGNTIRVGVDFKRYYPVGGLSLLKIKVAPQGSRISS